MKDHPFDQPTVERLFRAVEAVTEVGDTREILRQHDLDPQATWAALRAFVLSVESGLDTAEQEVFVAGCLSGLALGLTVSS